MKILFIVLLFLLASCKPFVFNQPPSYNTDDPSMSVATTRLHPQQTRTYYELTPRQNSAYTVVSTENKAKELGRFNTFQPALALAKDKHGTMIDEEGSIVWEPKFILPESTQIEGVPLIGQFPELARGCEVVSLTMLLNFLNIAADKMDLAEEVDKVPFEENGLRGNPYEGFVGNIYTFDKPGLSAYHGPIAKLASEYAGDERVADLTGVSFDEVLYQVANGNPVWAITTSTYRIVPEQEWHTWQTDSGEVNITYKQHSVVIIGYDEDYIYVNDPFLKDSKLNRTHFKESWEQTGSQAITIF